MSSSYILGGEHWTIARCDENYQGIARDVNDLRVTYVGNSKMAAFTAHKGIAYKVSEDFGYDSRVVKSNDISLQSCNIGQILNANPFSAPSAGKPSNWYFFQRFICGLHLPFLILGGGAVCATYTININNIDMRKWAALAATAWAGGTALWGMYNLCFGDSNVACDKEIARKRLDLRVRDQSDPKKWLLDRSQETGIVELLPARRPSAKTSQDAQSSSGSSGNSVDTVSDQKLREIVYQNACSFQIAYNRLDALPSRDYLPEAQGFYAQVYRKQNYGRILGSSIAAVGALFLAYRAQ